MDPWRECFPNRWANWYPIETAPCELEILATDCDYTAVIWFPEEPGIFTCSFSHYAVCQEWDWKPKYWRPLPPVPSVIEVDDIEAMEE